VHGVTASNIDSHKGHLKALRKQTLGKNITSEKKSDKKFQLIYTVLSNNFNGREKKGNFFKDRD